MKAAERGKGKVRARKARIAALDRKLYAITAVRDLMKMSQSPSAVVMAGGYLITLQENASISVNLKKAKKMKMNQPIAVSAHNPQEINVAVIKIKIPIDLIVLVNGYLTM